MTKSDGLWQHCAIEAVTFDHIGEENPQVEEGRYAEIAIGGSFGADCAEAPSGTSVSSSGAFCELHQLDLMACIRVTVDSLEYIFNRYSSITS